MSIWIRGTKKILVVIFIFWPPKLAIFGGHGHFARFEVPLCQVWGSTPTRSPSASWWPVSLLLQRDITLPDLRFCLMEPQIWQSGRVVKSSGQRFARFEVLPWWNLKSGKVATWPQGVQRKYVFWGLKMAKKCRFLLFRQDKIYKKYILQKKNGSKTSLQLSAMG